MNYAAADLHLAIAHHLLIFLLAGILAFEISVIRLTLTGADINRVGRVDAWYGILVLSIVPTVRIISWRRALAKNAAFASAGGDILKVRRFLWAEVAFFALIPAG